MTTQPKITAAKVQRAVKAIQALLDTREVNQPHYESPAAHETRADLYRAITACERAGTLRIRKGTQ